MSHPSTVSPYIAAAADRALRQGQPPTAPRLSSSQQDLEQCLAHQVDVAVTYLRRSLEDAKCNSTLCPAMYEKALVAFNDLRHDKFPTLEFVTDKMGHDKW